MSKEMTEVFVSITFKDCTKEEAIEAAKAIVQEAGYECGPFTEEQETYGDDGSTSVLGNLECEEGLYEEAEEEGEWSETDGRVTISLETP